MERKRRLPARAAARAEQVKKRNVTPRQRSITPVAPAPESPVDEGPPPAPPLPKSIQTGQPLPTLEEPQPEDLSADDYQTVTESGVLAESLSRSRHKWIHDGLFEKYWTKPHKRKGVVVEDPKNPPKDSMTKVGHVTINIEPHIIEATMYVVKAPKPPPGQQAPQQAVQVQQHPSPAASHPQAAAQQQQPALSRPVIQYGPPNGTMPPQKSQSSVVAALPTPVAAAVQLESAQVRKTQSGSPAPQSDLSKPQHAAVKSEPSQPISAADTPRSANTHGPATLAPARAPQATAGSLKAPPQPSRSGLSMPPGLAGSPSRTTPTPPAAGPSTTIARPAGVSTPGPAATPTNPASAAPKAAASDPVIALLAQKASGDAELRDLMKRVATGQAKPGELTHFQQIIDQLNQEYKRSGGQQGPSADRLLVDGKTVKWFAGEVRTILDIVLASNPNQKSSELKPPPRSDPLVVLLVKKALEDQRTRDIIRRIAEDRPSPYDAQTLKDTLDRLQRDANTASVPATGTPQARPPAVQGHSTHQPKLQPHYHANHQISNPQLIKSKGPPAPPKPDISAVVLDFGTGDRYMFPKYSILDTLSTPSGHQVVASFLIVRKGSVSEYGGDPKLDYYQPVTIRLQAQSGRQLENLARVVAPVEEVRRYMDDVMDNMTRAEYVLLAMRLPRRSPEEEKPETAEKLKSKAATPLPDSHVESSAATPRPAVLWTSKVPPNPGMVSPPQKPIRMADPEEETELRYQRLIQAVTAKDVAPV